MVAIEAISGSKTLQEIATKDAVHPIQMRLWKRRLLGACRTFPQAKSPFPPFLVGELGELLAAGA